VPEFEKWGELTPLNLYVKFSSRSSILNKYTTFEQNENNEISDSWCNWNGRKCNAKST